MGINDLVSEKLSDKKDAQREINNYLDKSDNMEVDDDCDMHTEEDEIAEITRKYSDNIIEENNGASEETVISEKQGQVFEDEEEEKIIKKVPEQVLEHILSTEIPNLQKTVEKVQNN